MRHESLRKSEGVRGGEREQRVEEKETMRERERERDATRVTKEE